MYRFVLSMRVIVTLQKWSSTYKPIRRWIFPADLYRQLPLLGQEFRLNNSAFLLHQRLSFGPLAQRCALHEVYAKVVRDRKKSFQYISYEVSFQE